VSRELNLIGTTVDDGVYRLEQFLSDALVAGLEEVRVVHGFGTCRLREGVHNYLRSNSVVKRFRLGRMGEDAGGGGATLVYL
jgi:DNA mismatch repair protein MutS2